MIKKGKLIIKENEQNYRKRLRKQKLLYILIVSLGIFELLMVLWVILSNNKGSLIQFINTAFSFDYAFLSIFLNLLNAHFFITLFFLTTDGNSSGKPISQYGLYEYGLVPPNKPFTYFNKEFYLPLKELNTLYVGVEFLWLMKEKVNEKRIFIKYPNRIYIIKSVIGKDAFEKSKEYLKERIEILD